MASPTFGTTHRNPDNSPHRGGPVVDEREHQGGVSDERRAELKELEAAADRSSDAPSLAQRPSRGAPGNADTTPVNPDTDKH